jgi:hypothetical protein
MAQNGNELLSQFTPRAFIEQPDKSSRTAQAVQGLPVTRATAANLSPVISHSTFSNVGTASIRLIAATARTMS